MSHHHPESHGTTLFHGHVDVTLPRGNIIAVSSPSRDHVIETLKQGITLSLHDIGKD